MIDIWFSNLLMWSHLYPPSLNPSYVSRLFTIVTLFGDQQTSSTQNTISIHNHEPECFIHIYRFEINIFIRPYPCLGKRYFFVVCNLSYFFEGILITFLGLWSVDFGSSEPFGEVWRGIWPSNWLLTVDIEEKPPTLRGLEANVTNHETQCLCSSKSNEPWKILRCCLSILGRWVCCHQNTLPWSWKVPRLCSYSLHVLLYGQKVWFLKELGCLTIRWRFLLLLFLSSYCKPTSACWGDNKDEKSKLIREDNSQYQQFGSSCHLSNEFNSLEYILSTSRRFKSRRH